MKNNFIIVFVTCSSKREALKISDSLLKKRLVACANVIAKISSRFWWMGKIDSASETLVIFKTSISNFKELEREVRKIHSYDVPEIVAIPMVAMSKDYMSWIRSSVK